MRKSRHRYPSAQEVSATNLRNFRTFLLMRQFAAREIGARIAQCRREAGGMTQEDLAEALNVSKRSVQDYEAGVTIPWKYFQRLEQIFGRPLDWFLHGTEATGESGGGLPDEMLADIKAAVEAAVREALTPGEAITAAVAKGAESALRAARAGPPEADPADRRRSHKRGEGPDGLR